MKEYRINKQYMHLKNQRPLLGVMWEPMIEASNLILRKHQTGDTLSAGEFSSRIMLDTAERIRPKAEQLQSDLPFAYQACCGSQWLEAILGCRIITAENAVWASHASGNSLESFLREPVRTEWLDRLLECHAAMCEWANGDRFCSMPLLHGPLDVLAAYVGAEKLGLSFYDEPELLAECLDKAADTYIRVTKMLEETIRKVHGGYAGRMHFFTEEKCATMQDDASYLCSPQLFEKWVVPAEKKIASEPFCVLYHMHNTSLHLWENISRIGYKAIQVSVDPNGGPIEEQINVYREMQRSAPLMLSCWDMAQMDQLAKALAPEGLCLTFIPSPAESQITETGAFHEFDAWNEFYSSRISVPS